MQNKRKINRKDCDHIEINYLLNNNKMLKFDPTYNILAKMRDYKI